MASMSANQGIIGALQGFIPLVEREFIKTFNICAEYHQEDAKTIVIKIR
jgi:hypothetical protein